MSIDVFTRAEVARMFKVSLRTVDRWAQDGKVRFVKLGDGPKAPIRFRKRDIEEFLDSSASITKHDMRELMGKRKAI